MPKVNQEKKPIKRVKYSNEFKLYVIIYMREHHLSNKEALRKFLPHQNSNSAKTIRDWKKIYKEKGPAGFFTMNNTNNTDNNTTKTNNTKLTDPNMDFSNLSHEELQKVTRELLLKLCVTEREREILKKKQK